MQIHVCVAGLKGSVFLDELLCSNVPLAKAFAYRQNDDRSQGFDKIAGLCNSYSIPLVETRRPTIAETSDADLVFFVGWQYLLPFEDDRFIVFHDSLLPRYRGFAPTAEALIAGDEIIGVTALKPTRELDSGPIFAQAELRVDHPALIGDVLQRQAHLMVDVAKKLMVASTLGPLAALPQDESQATYSIWRDAEDYFIDWTESSQAIERFVHAVGYPYEGARSIFEDQVAIITACAALPQDLTFSSRHPGKIWRISENGPVVICGSGLLQLSAIESESGKEIQVGKLRSRFRGLKQSKIGHVLYEV